MCCYSQQYIAGPVGGSGVAILWGEWGVCGGEHKVGPQTPHTMVERWDHALEGSDTDARCCQGRPENLLPHLRFHQYQQHSHHHWMQNDHSINCCSFVFLKCR